MKNIIVEPLTTEKTLGEYLSQDLRLGTRSALKEAFLKKKIHLNGRPEKRTALIKSGDRIEIKTESVVFLDELAILPNPDLPLKVLLQNESVIVVNKPSGEFTNPQRPFESDTTMNALAAQFPETTVKGRPELPLEGLMVHRLDYGTSGLLVCARSLESFEKLRSYWKSRVVEKVYLAWVSGEVKSSGEVRAFLWHDPKNKKKMLVSKSNPKSEKITSWAARTAFDPLLSINGKSLILVRIFSGVTHQIRATMASMGHPVVGDILYKGSAPKVPLSTDDDVDAETQKTFKKLRSLLPELGAVSELDLPPRSFFLHALWLKVPGIGTLEDGVLCPPPEYFG